MAKRNQKPVFGFKIGPMSCYTANVRSSEGGENHELQLEEAQSGGASSSTGGETANHLPAAAKERGIVRLSGSSQKTKPFFGVKVGPMSCYMSTARGPPGPLGRHGHSGSQAPDATGLVEGIQPSQDVGEPVAEEEGREPQETHDSPGLPHTLKADKSRWEPTQTAAASPARAEDARKSPERHQQQLPFGNDEAAMQGSPAPSPVKDAPDAPRVLSDAILELEETGEITKAADLLTAKPHRARKPGILARILPWCCGDVQ
mmetsp:Transcript_25118/g.55029  ORF Transcript_25118/g.55029 Transcript_25118/m.55029 type:complete len:260 (-) Transcript_25118:72-851(-)